MAAKHENGDKVKYLNVHIRFEAAASSEEDSVKFRVQVVKGLRYDDRIPANANSNIMNIRRNLPPSNNIHISPKQVLIYHVPDFLSVDDGNLRYTHTDHFNIDTYYYHECDIGKDNRYAERYVQKLASYPFKLINHFVNDFRGTSYAMLGEVWDYIYTGPENIKSVEAYNVQHINDKYNIHLRVAKTLYGAEGRISFSIRVAKGLAYDERSIINKNSVSGGNNNNNNKPSNYSSPIPSSSQSQKHEMRVHCSKCHGDKKIECRVCNGSKGKYEYGYDTPNYIGKKGGARQTRVWRSCSNCNGTGKVECPECGGRGYTVQVSNW